VTSSQSLQIPTKHRSTRWRWAARGSHVGHQSAVTHQRQVHISI